MGVPTSISDRFLKSRILCIGIRDSHDAQGLLLTVIKGEVKVEKAFSGFGEISGFLRDNALISVIVNIHSNQVISTVFSESITPDNLEDVFQDNVPNGSLNDFIITYAANSLSFARKSAVAVLLEPFNFCEEQIVGVFFSPTSGLVLAKYLKGGDLQFQLGEFVFSFQGDLLEDTAVLEDTKELLIDGEQLSGSQALLYGAVIHFLSLGEPDPNTEIEWRKEELVFKAIYTKVRMPILATFLVVFLVNTILFFIFDEKNQKLTEKSSYIQQLDSKLNTLNQFIADNEKIRRVSDNRYSFLSDQIGHYTPSGITLTRLIINPIADRRSETAFQTDKMLIKGVTINAQVFSSWLERLNKLEWLERVEKQTYESVKTGSAESNFQIVIHYNVEKLKI